MPAHLLLIIFIGMPRLPQILIIAPLTEQPVLRQALVGRYTVFACQGQLPMPRQDFDVVILHDKVNGAEKRLTKLQAMSRPPSIVFVGPRPVPEDAIKILRAGAFDYLIEPIVTGHLLATVEQALENRRSFLKIMSLSDRLKIVNTRLSEQNECLAQERDHLKQRNDDLNVLNQIGQRLVGSFETDELVHDALTRIGDLVPYDLLALAWLPSNRSWGQASSQEAGGHIAGYQRNTLEHASRYAGHISSVMELSADPHELEIGLLSAGQCLGLLRVMRRPAMEAFSTYETELLSALANSLALAIRGAEAHQEVQSLASTDSLTNLLNRRAFGTVFVREFKKAARYQQSLGLLMIDIDHFKAINDRFGHPVGDSVLRQMGIYLSQTIREVDIAARFGGEEFAILLPGAAGGHPFYAAERIRRAIHGHAFLPEAPDYRVTVSIGVTQYKGDGGSQPEDLLREADVALYRAKTNGRNRVEVAGLSAVVLHPASQSLQPVLQ